MQFFKKSPEEQRVQDKLDRIENAKQSEQFRAPNPRTIQFPEENFIDFQVIQEGKLIKLKTYRFPPKDNQIKAIVFMFHGLCAHINHGAHLAAQFSAIGCLVVGFDHRGFGKSEGIRGYLESIDSHLNDSFTFVQMILNFYKFPKVPIFLTGLSMGGMTAFRLAISKKFPIRGIILFAPAIMPLQSSITIKAVQFLGFVSPKGKFIKPKKGIATKNPQVSEDHFNDPYTYSDEMLPKTAATILSGMAESQEMIPLLENPFLLIQGGLDKLVDPDVILELDRKSKSNDKTILFYENCWHDIWHEQEIHDIIPKVVKWISDRMN